MHVRLLLTTEADSAEEARFLASDWMSNAMCSTLADWFVVGGRWSGLLSMCHLPQEKLDAVYKEIEEKKLYTLEKSRERAKVFKKHFPDFKEEPLTARDPYRIDGYPDDAQLVDREIYEKLLKEYEGNYEVKDESGLLHFFDLDFDPVSPDFIGNKYIVVIDYHI